MSMRPMSTRIIRTSLATLCLSIASLPAAALPITLAPLADTHIDSAEPDANFAGDPTIFVRREIHQTHGLLHFDLSSLAGQGVAGDGVLSLFLESGLATAPGTREIELYAVSIDWDAGSVTYNNFGATPGLDIGSDTAAAPLDVVDVPYSGGTDIGWFDWTVPGSLLNAWIADPSSNHGLLLRNSAGNPRSLRFSSSESPEQPTLRFEAVPGPPTAVLLAAALLGLAVRRAPQRR